MSIDTKLIRQTISLLSSMINGGEFHSQESEEAIRRAYIELDVLESQPKGLSDEEIEGIVEEAAGPNYIQGKSYAMRLARLCVKKALDRVGGFTDHRLPKWGLNGLKK